MAAQLSAPKAAMNSKPKKKTGSTPAGKAQVPLPKKVTTTKGKEVLVQTIHPAAANYAKVLYDPFNVTEEACLPFGDPIKSSKTCYFVKGIMQLSTTGQGFVLFKPTNANDAICCSVTTATSVGTKTTPLDSFTNTQVYYPIGCPYTSSQYGTGSSLGTRFVGGGVRVKYFDKMLDRNGLATTVEEVDHQSIENYTIAGLQNNNFTRTVAISDKEWDAVVYYSGGTDPKHFYFQNGIGAIYPLGQDFTMGIVFEGQPGDKFWFEIKYFMETCGREVPSKTMTVPDIV